MSHICVKNVNCEFTNSYNNFKRNQNRAACVLTRTLHRKLFNFSWKRYRALFEDYFSIISLILYLSIWFYKNTLTMQKEPWQTDFFFRESFYLRNS